MSLVALRADGSIDPSVRVFTREAISPPCSVESLASLLRPAWEHILVLQEAVTRLDLAASQNVRLVQTSDAGRRASTDADISVFSDGDRLAVEASSQWFKAETDMAQVHAPAEHETAIMRSKGITPPPVQPVPPN